jgi:Na+/H+ antiporter NhaC
MGAGCDHIEHVRTQVWYALTVGGIAIFFGYLPVGMGISIYIVLPLAVIATILMVRFIGKSVDAIEEENDIKVKTI